MVKTTAATATSIICGKCGVYPGAILADGDKSWPITNTRGLAMTEFASRTGEHMGHKQKTAMDAGSGTNGPRTH